MNEYIYSCLMVEPDLLKNKWEKGVDWKNLLPPSRPSSYHVQVFRNTLDSLSRRTPVAILGSTPELRDVCASLGFENVFVFTNSLGFHTRVESLRCYKNDETIVLGDWLDTLPKYKEIFCAVLSDLTSGNIPYAKQELFYQNIANALVHDGIFIDKILICEIPFTTLESLDEKYKMLPFNLQTLNYFSCEYFFCSQLVEEYKLTDVDKFFSILSQRFSHPVLKRFLEDCLLITPSGGVWYYGLTWEQAKINYYKSLKSVSMHEEEENSPYYRRLKILVSKKSI